MAQRAKAICSEIARTNIAYRDIRDRRREVDEVITPSTDDCRQRVLIVLPVRLGSTRLPQKAILDKTGKPQWSTQQSKPPDPVTPIKSPSRATTTTSKVLSSPTATNTSTPVNTTLGSSRCAEVMDRLNADIVVNVQGESPKLIPITLTRSSRP